MSTNVRRFAGPIAALVAAVGYCTNWVSMSFLGINVSGGPVSLHSGWGIAWALLLTAAAIGAVVENSVVGRAVTGALAVGSLVYTGNFLYDYFTAPAATRVLASLDLGVWLAAIGAVVAFGLAVYEVVTGE